MGGGSGAGSGAFQLALVGSSALGVLGGFSFPGSLGRLFLSCCLGFRQYCCNG